MKLQDIYDLFIKEGIKTDPRSFKQTRRKLVSTKRAFNKLEKSLKKFFDTETLTNPYSDTRILFGDPHVDIKRILVGIDMEVSELLLADRLCQSGLEIDLILAHHPEGIALAGLDEVMDLQSDVLQGWGLKAHIARDLMKARIKEVARRLHGTNHTRAVDAARLLHLPFMCCHTPSDNHVVHYLEKRVNRSKPKRLKDIIGLLLKEPEYQDAMRTKAGPMILLGKPEDKAGKVIVDMTGGTEGSKDIFARLSQSGVDTLLCMHLSEDHYKKIKNEHINVIVAGHMASDNLGMNLLLDKLQRKDNFEIIECSGFRRFERYRPL